MIPVIPMCLWCSPILLVQGEYNACLETTAHTTFIYVRVLREAMGDHKGELVHYTLECMAVTSCPVMDVRTVYVW